MKTIEHISENEIRVDGETFIRAYGEIKTPEFKVGDWVKLLHNEDKYTLKISSIIGDDYHLWFTDHEGPLPYSKNDIRHATKEEIESYLIEEAERKGYRDGIRLWSFYEDLTPYIKDDKGYELEGKLSYDFEEDSLKSSIGLRVYRKGKWAEIIPEKKKLPKTKEEFIKLVEEFGRNPRNLDDFLNQYEDA